MGKKTGQQFLLPISKNFNLPLGCIVCFFLNNTRVYLFWGLTVALKKAEDRQLSILLNNLNWEQVSCEWHPHRIILLLWDNHYFSLCRFRLLYAYIVITCPGGVVYSLTQKNSLNAYYVFTTILDTRDTAMKESLKIFALKEIILYHGK